MLSGGGFPYAGRKAEIRMTKKRIIVTVAFAGTALLLLGLMLLSRRFPEATTSVYTLKIFKYVSLPVKAIAELFPFSLAEAALYAAVILILLTLVISVIRCFKEGRARPLLRQISAVLIAASLALICYVSLGGFNYSALTFAERENITLKGSTVQELQELCLYLSEKAAENRNQLHQDENGTVTCDASVFDICKSAQAGYDLLRTRYPEFSGFYVTPKPAVASEVMCYLQISGIYPYIVPEAIVNYKTPLCQLPHTVCHEMAHQRGIAREDEANYISYLACILNPDPLFRYSGYMEALSYSLNALYAASSAAYRQIRPMIHEGVLRDIGAASAFWRSFEQKNETVAKVSSTVNNTYLQAQNIPDGERSYGRMVDLLLADRGQWAESLLLSHQSR